MAIRVNESFLDSDIWKHRNRSVPIIYLTALLVGRYQRFKEPIPTLDMNGRKTGSSTPPGKHGFAEANTSGIVEIANVAEWDGLSAVAFLCEKGHLIKTRRGFVIPEFHLYAIHDPTAAARMARMRARRKEAA